MRIRYYPGKARWTVNVRNMTGTAAEYLRAWAGEMMLRGVSLHDDVCIDLPDGRKHISITELRRMNV